MKQLLGGIFFLLICNIGLAEELAVDSKAVRVTIYSDSALITREASVSLKEGIQDVVFSKIPEGIDEGTLSVSAEGTAKAKLLGAKVKRVFLEKVPSEEISKLKDEIQKLEDTTRSLNNEKSVIYQAREFLKSINNFSSAQIPKELATKMPKAEELGGIYAFLSMKWQETFKSEEAIDVQIRDLNVKLDKLRRELAQLGEGAGKSQLVIITRVDVEKTGSLKINTDYLVRQATWMPEYDARVNYEKERVELVCFGIIRQNTGEEWKDIRLFLSTGKPTVSGKMPELESWFLKPYEPPILYEKRAMRQDRYFEAEKNVVGAALPMAPAEEAKVADLQYAQMESKITSVSYEVMNTVTLKPDGSEERVPIFSVILPAKFEYSSTPKLSPYAYLNSKVKNEMEQLLAGQVRVFLENVYIGTSSVGAIGKDEEFYLYLGIDEGVKVKREKLEEKRDEMVLGMKKNTITVIYKYKLSVENYKNKNIKFNLFDNIPISQNDQIKVKVLEISEKPKEENYKDKTGVMRWEFDLAPKEKKEIILRFQVEYPRDIGYIGL
ncbi:MAG: mucoidy inhibitor MuiA family protein [Candidatus Omnitrophica bacterium]|nr:mucoidy inhibitor MuiA family protein [Candidatus Omnitrophota bacterium]